MKAVARVLVSFFLCLVLGAIIGCSGAKSSDSSGSSSPPGTQPSPGQAQITALSPNTIPAASASFTLTVTGLNFTPSTTVMWDVNNPLATTYVSPTQLQAQVTTSLLATSGITTIVPSPVGKYNFGTSFTVTNAALKGNTSFTITRIPVEANDFAWSPTDGLFYVAVSGADKSRPNTITSLNPQTGQFISSRSTGTNPYQVAVSSDGVYLYTSLKDSNSISRYVLPSLQFDLSIPLATSSSTTYVTQYWQIQPTNSHTIAVSRLVNSSTLQSDISIYDDNIARAHTVTSELNDSKFAWNTNGQILYVSHPLTNTLSLLSVDSTGVQLKENLPITGPSPLNPQFDSTTGYLYSDAGPVCDPSTATNVGIFSLRALPTEFFNSMLVLDRKLNIAYFLGSTLITGPHDFVIAAFDLTHFNLLGTATIPNVTGVPIRFVRWGDNGLAFLSTDPDNTGTDGAVYMISGSFVTSPAAP